MNGPPIPPTADRTHSVTDCFEAIAEANDNRVAVDDGETTLSYEALNARANRIARAIRRASRGDDAVIALMLSFGASAVAGYLGTMKTGLPSVRLDPATPIEQNRKVLADAGASLLVTDAANLRLARSLAGETINLIGIEDIDPAMPTSNLETKVSPDAVAAITYTSGSTGAPKGYCHSHRYLVDAAGLLQKLGEITAQSRFMVPFGIATGPHLSYGISVLLSGGILCPFPLGARGPSAFLDALGSDDITALGMIPSAFRLMLADLPDTAAFPAMRAVILGSEPAYDTDVALWRRHFPTSERLVNLYASVDAGFVSAFVVDHETEVPSGALPAGFPLGDKKIVIREESGAVLDKGEVGEIVVETTLGTPGYWRRPDLTAKSVHPPQQPGGMWTYRTGDLGHLDRAGCLRLSGRKDGRTKILGNRIETGAVEAALLAVEGITEATALVIENDDARRRRRLVAFIAGRTDLPTSATLRQRLSASLPRSMVPLEFHRLDALPRLPGGKVDRKALRDKAQR